MSTLNYRDGTTTPLHPAFSLPSILAAVSAIATFVVHSAGARLGLAVLAAIFGVIGIVISLLPGKRGGLISLASLAIGAIAFIVAIIQAISNMGSHNTTTIVQ